MILVPSASAQSCRPAWKLHLQGLFLNEKGRPPSYPKYSSSSYRTFQKPLSPEVSTLLDGLFSYYRGCQDIKNKGRFQMQKAMRRYQL